MEKVLKIIKINLLSIIALPILLLSILSQLISKAIKYLGLILAIVSMISIVAIILEFIQKPESFFDFLIIAIILLIVASLTIFLLIFFIGIIINIITFISMKLISIFEFIYSGLTYLYGFIFNICSEEYKCISDDNKIKNRLFCIFYTMLNILNKIIIILLSHSMLISFLCSISIFIGTIIYGNIIINRDFGINIVSYICMFNWRSNLEGIVLYILTIGGLALVLINIGIEFEEWAEELKTSTLDCKKYVDSILNKNDLLEESLFSNKTTGDENIEKYNKYIDYLQNHINELEELLQRIATIEIDKNENITLKNKYISYITTFNEVMNSIEKYNGEIPLNKLKRLIPKIKELNILKEDVNKLFYKAYESQGYNKDNKAQEKSNNSFKKTSFFTGCDTKEKLEKRYKSLCKTYHPDMECGDEETFKAMKEEYDSLKG